VLLLPTMREPAPLISETINEAHRRPPSNTAAFNHFGTPALTLPCGFSKDGLPIGLQIVAAPFREPYSATSRVRLSALRLSGTKRLPPLVRL